MNLLQSVKSYSRSQKTKQEVSGEKLVNKCCLYRVPPTLKSGNKNNTHFRFEEPSRAESGHQEVILEETRREIGRKRRHQDEEGAQNEVNNTLLL